MPNQLRDISSVDKDSYSFICEQNVDAQLKTFAKGLVCVNVSRPKTDRHAPVLVTYGTYGKDLPYAEEGLYHLVELIRMLTWWQFQ